MEDKMKRTVKVEKDKIVIHVSNSEEYTKEDMSKLYTSLCNRRDNMQAQVQGQKDQIMVFEKGIADTVSQIKWLEKEVPKEFLVLPRVEVKALAGDASGKGKSD